MKGLRRLTFLTSIFVFTINPICHSAESTKGFSLSIEQSAKIEFTLKPQNEIHLGLFGKKPPKNTKDSVGISNNRDSYLGQLIFSDKDCNLGHKASITYNESNKNWLIQYAEKTLPWEKPISIVFEPQKDSKTLLITINGEVFSITTTTTIKYLHISDENLFTEITTSKPKLFDKD